MLRSRLGHVPQRFASTSGESSSSFRTIRKLSVYTSIAGIAYTVGSFTLLQSQPPPPLHPEAPEAVAYVESLEDSLQRLPPLQRHRETAKPDEWYEARPYAKVPRERRVNSLTSGSLNGPGNSRSRHCEAMAFVHVGSALCGHEGIVHGGRQFLVIKTRLIEAKGRKSKVAGVIEDMDGNVLVEAEALFIQPKYAKLLNTARMRELLGEPGDSREPISEGANAPVPVSPPSGPSSIGGAKA
ncbi:uncharacterized protein B0H18DRAFT_1013612 [Fomitopsis serialis]|uniref:uncharacterized protein n=1 Tax=Fomitopsis serialis TaxID=139415 RepID=UPI0020076E00|nr:uncharacterized protein B0H18DRAFT_1013612 [Neoantrodia serialis]KAH9923842.1 hypothetical protein B0H18DRAFT_1013612 [Neoantrodia serialis]